VHGRNILGSKTTAGNNESVGERGKPTEKSPNIIQQAREEYGRYFGICSSYHHLKACTCKSCPSYSGGAGMFCSRSKFPGQGKKEGCLCEACELFRKFRLEGEYFCMQNEKPEFPEEKPDVFPDNRRKASESNGKTRICVLGDYNRNA
jgi:hypothetical protein